MTPADVEATVKFILWDHFWLHEREFSRISLTDALHGEAGDALELLDRLEKAFGIEIDGDTIAWPTVGALIEDMQRRVAALGAAQEQ